MWRCEDEKMWRCQDEKMWWRCEHVKMYSISRPSLLEEAFAQTLWWIKEKKSGEKQERTIKKATKGKERKNNKLKTNK
jgi:hypothetical protein